MRCGDGGGGEDGRGVLNTFGETLLDHLDERGMGVPDLVEEIRPALERCGLDYTYTTDEVVAAVTDPLAPLPVGMLLGVAEALGLDGQEWEELCRAAMTDADWRLLANRVADAEPGEFAKESGP